MWYASSIALAIFHSDEYSLQQRSLLSKLSRFKRLRFLDLEVDEWNPPLVGAFQRAVAAELRIYVSELGVVGFWAGHEHVLWAWNPEHAEQIEAVLPSSRDSKSSMSPSVAGKAAERDLQGQNMLGLQMGGAGAKIGRNDVAELKEEATVVSYTSVDGWTCYPARHGNTVWWKAAGMDDFWMSTNVVQAARRR